MKPWHKSQGLTEAGAQIADHALDKAIALLVAASGSPGLAKIILDEAIFRVCELPLRLRAFQEKYLEENK